jgi:hypothetical protein
MTRPLIVDTFPFNNELDLLECRLTEIADSVDHVVLVESQRDHQDHPKPLWFAEHRERFAAWSDKLIHVIVPEGGLPSMADDDDPWAREHAQREFIANGLERIPYDDDTIILQSDVDEIPRALQARNVRPGGELWSFAQRGHFWAVDWLYPQPWFGTVATTVRKLKRFQQTPFAYMRDSRMTARNPPHLNDAGWHFSWMGGAEAAMAKVGSFCHPEVEDRIVDGLANNSFYVGGIHVDGQRMHPVDVDESWPKWIREGNAPASWYRQR